MVVTDVAVEVGGELPWMSEFHVFLRVVAESRPVDEDVGEYGNVRAYECVRVGRQLQQPQPTPPLFRTSEDESSDPAWPTSRPGDVRLTGVQRTYVPQRGVPLTQQRTRTRQALDDREGVLRKHHESIELMICMVSY